MPTIIQQLLGTQQLKRTQQILCLQYLKNCFGHSYATTEITFTFKR